tara:strand:+ start:152972 stop:153772 length:801 start_codon:yes stop_codon:yes gene_type:complete
MNKKTSYSILIALCIIGFWLFDNFYTPATYSKTEDNNEALNFPIEFFPNSSSGEVVDHEYYSLSYNEKYEQAEWVAYKLESSQLTYNDRQRPDFIEDPKVKTKSADWRNYRGSGYDRGHLCPAGDRRFSEYAYNETFYTSNISPQNNDFNAGIWNDLEKQVRYWCKVYNTVYVITGGVLEDDLPSIGEEDVSVPNYFYKIIARNDGAEIKTIGFLFENKQTETSLKSHLVSIDELERKTGLNFFEKLPNALENKLESSIVEEGWKF